MAIRYIQKAGFLGFVAQLLSRQYAIRLIGVAVFAFFLFFKPILMPRLGNQSSRYEYGIYSSYAILLRIAPKIGRFKLCARTSPLFSNPKRKPQNLFHVILVLVWKLNW